MSKINSINDMQRLMETLGAKKETGDGWASWTIDCGPGRLTHTDLSIKPQASSNKRQADALWRPGIRVKNIKRRKI